MNIWIIVPECILLVWAILLASLWNKPQDLSHPIGLLRAGLGVMAAVIALGSAGFGGLSSLFFNDPFSLFFKFGILTILSFSLFLMGGSRQWRGRDLAFLYLSTFGCMIVAGANELAAMFIGVSTATISLCIFLWLTASDERDRVAVRKWFTFAIIATATLVFGMSLVYGLSASTQIVQSKVNLAIVHLTKENIGVILAIAEVFLLVGVTGLFLAPPLAGKLAAESSERMHPGVTAFRIGMMMTLGFLIFAKLFDNNLSAFQGIEMKPNDWGVLATVFASAAMILGGVFALKSTDLMSVIVWLTMSQVGAIWQSWIWLSEQGISAAGFGYASLLLAIFAVISVVALLRERHSGSDSDSFTGLWHRAPVLGAVAIVGLFSIVGMPATVGYNARLLWFSSGVAEAGPNSLGEWTYIALTAGAISTLLSAIAVFPWVKRIVQTTPITEPVEGRGAFRSVAFVTVLAIIILGLFSAPLDHAVSGLPLAFGFLPR
jgi:NADH-quinone oxidoreductase subunit N